MAKTKASESPKKQLETFFAKYTPEMAALGRKCYAKMCKRLPSAQVLVYDNYNALAIGFSPTERASDGIFSLALFPRQISLFFLQGAGLPDPHKRFEGSGNVARHIKLKGAESLDDPQIVALMQVALNRAKVPLDPKQRGNLIIKSISAKQRPRRPASGANNAKR